MARPPKQWKLTENESFSSFTSWQHNLLYTLNQDDVFKPFLVANYTWTKTNNANPVRGLVDDAEGDHRQTAAQKLANLTQMLGLISQWVPHYLTADITKNSTSIDSIWQSIRKYYGFQQSETQFMKYSSITWEDGERPERLYQRIIAHLQDNLLQKDSKLKHDGIAPDKDEELSPTVERLAVLRWMELIHPGLPALVQRTFAFDLQRMTLKDMQPQIVDALDGFLEELRQDEAKVGRVFMPDYRRRSRPPNRAMRFPQPSRTTTKQPTRKYMKECRVCKCEGRSYMGHNLGECDYISRAEKSSISSFRVDIDHNDHPTDICDNDHSTDICEDISEEFHELQVDLPL